MCQPFANMMDDIYGNTGMSAGGLLESEGESKGRHKEIVTDRLDKDRPACLNFSTYMFS